MKPNDFVQCLQGKFGFTECANRSTDHRWFELRLPNLPPILTKVSHSRDEIRNKLKGKIARQLRVQGAFFDGMFSCTKSRADYEKQVQSHPHPPWDDRS